jgi:penicillin amidase
MSILDNIGGMMLKPVIKMMSDRRLPKIDGNVYVSGLKEEVKVIRDRWGVPHIYAANGDDALFAQGYVHAQDRLWQMELNRRVARGKLSEFIGKDGLDTDRVCKTMGYERVAKKDWELFGPEEHRIIFSYCAGINAFIKDNKDNLPVEFSLLGIVPEMWEPIDVLSFSRLLIALLSWGWYDEIIRAKIIESVGEEAAAELDNTYTPHHPFTLPEGIEFNMLDLESKFSAMKGPYMPQLSGSNAWTVHGSKTVTGKPFLCNDPHLTLRNPNIWYMVHLHCPEFHVSGVSAPSLPMVLIGHNEKIGWGITLSFTDIEDVYVEKFTDDTCSSYVYKNELLSTEVIDEKIYVKGEADPYIERVLQTIHGPVISDITGYKRQKLALCSQALKPSKAVYGWFKLNESKSWNDFVDGVKEITAPGLNIVYADVEGNIGYYNSGKVPVKTKETASLPMPGWTGENDWKDFVPFEEMPHALNPKKGYIITCNNKIEPDDYPHFLGDIYMNGYRAKRLEQMFSAKSKFAPGDFTDMQMDFTCLPGLQFGSLYKDLHFEDPELQQFANTLISWDGILDAERYEGSIYKVTKLMVVRKLYESAITDRKLIDELLGRGFNSFYGPVNAFLGHNTVTLLRVINNPQSWWLEKAGGKDKLLREGLKNAIQWLKLNYGNKKEKWKWGRLHAIVFSHALGVKKPLDKVFNIGPFPIGGDTDTPHQTCILSAEGYGGELSAPSYRQTIDFSNFDKSTMIMPLGQSGNMASPYYKNQLKDWFEGHSIPMCWSKYQVEEHKAHEMYLKKKLS